MGLKFAMENQCLVIGFITDKPLCDVKTWSGTYYHLNNFINETEFRTKELLIKENFLLHCFRLFLKKFFNYESSTLYKIRRLKVRIKVKKALKEGINYFFVPSGSKLISTYSFPQSCKVIYLTDATIYIMRNYYWKMTNHSFKVLNKCEITAANRSNAIIVSSEWAKQSFLKDYQINQKKLFTLRFPAYLKDEYIPKVYKKHSLILLFVGVERERKGLDIAIEAFKHLKKFLPNYKLILNVVGLTNLKNINIEGIFFYGRLDKQNPSDLSLLINLYKEASLFILPTRAECSAIVYSEASMYGLPIFTTDTGGISSYVENGINGYRLNLECGGLDYAKVISENIENLQKLSVNARKFYEEKLSSKIWKTSFINIIKQI